MSASSLGRIRELLAAWQAGSIRERELAELRDALSAVIGVCLPADVEEFVADCEALAKHAEWPDMARLCVIIRAQGAENDELTRTIGMTCELLSIVDGGSRLGEQIFARITGQIQRLCEAHEIKKERDALRVRLAKLETAALAACESCPEFRVPFEHADKVYALREVLGEDLHAMRRVVPEHDLPADTEAFVAEVEARANKATPGPWRSVRNGSGLFGGLFVAKIDDHHGQTYVSGSYGFSTRDATFVASARADVPRLITIIRAKEADIASLRNASERECESTLLAHEERDALRVRLAKLETAARKLVEPYESGLAPRSSDICAARELLALEIE